MDANALPFLVAVLVGINTLAGAVIGAGVWRKIGELCVEVRELRRRVSQLEGKGPNDAGTNAPNPGRLRAARATC
jgi:outer membrane murein-binding lipoprotein Lpp